MRTAVVFFAPNSRDRVLNIARSLARGMESQGHQVDIVDGTRDVNTKLTIYQYLAVGTEPASNFGGKIPEKVGQFLNSSGMVAGKRSFAFVTKNMAGAPKALSRLMKSMEKEGMFIKYSAVLSSAQEAEEIGKRLHVAR
jgi:menaquinone-dependent protoporphyrinogen IX oxidase